MVTVPTFSEGDEIRLADGKTGKVLMLVPAMANPFLEMRKRFGTSLRYVNVRRSDMIQGREVESYLVEIEYRGRKRITWPSQYDMQRAVRNG